MSAWERVLDNLRTTSEGFLAGSRGKTRAPGTGTIGATNAAAAASQAAQAARYQGFANNPLAAAAYGQAVNPVVSTVTGSGGGGGGGGDVTTNPGDPSQFQPDPYPTVLPSLSAAQLGQLAERRRLADERLKRAKAEAERRTTLFEANAERARQSGERESRRSIEDFMRQAAGKSLARSPMVAGRFQRRAGEDLRLVYGEIDTRLSTDIMALQDLVRDAADRRDTELALIEQERVNMQADLERLFPAASMMR